MTMWRRQPTVFLLCRFLAPPAGLQDSFLLRPPSQGAPAHLTRTADFTGIRPLPVQTAAGAHLIPGVFPASWSEGQHEGLCICVVSHPHVPPPPPGVPQPFLPRSLPLQQHSIMGQPYIELRHRAPEHRLRMAFAHEPQQGSPLGQLVLEQQQQLALPTAPLGQAAEAVLPGSDGMEEHLEGEDSAVKDLEDVEVKDLVDLNLNLDTEDGRPCPPRSSGARVH